MRPPGTQQEPGPMVAGAPLPAAASSASSETSSVKRLRVSSSVSSWSTVVSFMALLLSSASAPIGSGSWSVRPCRWRCHSRDRRPCWTTVRDRIRCLQKTKLGHRKHSIIGAASEEAVSRHRWPEPPRCGFRRTAWAKQLSGACIPHTDLPSPPDPGPLRSPRPASQSAAPGRWTGAGAGG
jgi:hypothetical protein